MNINIYQERLEEDIVFCIRQFQRYSEIYPIERNKIVLEVLEKLLNESKKMQTEECILNP